MGIRNRVALRADRERVGPRSSVTQGVRVSAREHVGARCERVGGHNVAVRIDGEGRATGRRERDWSRVVARHSDRVRESGTRVDRAAVVGVGDRVARDGQREAPRAGITVGIGRRAGGGVGTGGQGARRGDVAVVVHEQVRRTGRLRVGDRPAGVARGHERRRVVRRSANRDDVGGWRGRQRARGDAQRVREGARIAVDV